MKNILNKKAEGYIDICVGLIVLLTVLVLTINIYSFFTLRQDLDQISNDLIETATFEGCFGERFEERKERLKEEFFDFETETDADLYFNTAKKQVQLGKAMRVTVSVHTTLQGTGIVKIPITAKSTRSGLSEKYWKVE